MVGMSRIFRPRPRRGEDCRASFAKRRNDRLADTLGAAGDERAFSFELQEVAHQRISSYAIFPSFSTKLNSSVAGLPGKLPVSLALRTVFPSRSATSSGATVWLYFFFVSAFHSLIAANPSYA